MYTDDIALVVANIGSLWCEMFEQWSQNELCNDLQLQSGILFIQKVRSINDYMRGFRPIFMLTTTGISPVTQMYCDVVFT